METAWETIGRTIFEEFHDLANIADWTKAALRLIVAATLTGLLGFEREIEGKAAGVRTHILVGLGAALIVIAPSLANMPIESMSRVIQGIVSGIGFLGAGAILKRSDEGDIRGLTTAAGLWISAAVGMTVGLGRLALAIFATVVTLIVLGPLGRLLWQVTPRATDGAKPANRAD